MTLRREFVPMLRLAVPLAAAELAWMAMGVVDTVMVGPLGPAALGAGSLGTMIFYVAGICGTGLLYGMDTLAAHAHGAGDAPEARQWLISGLWLAAMLAPVTISVALAALPFLRWFGIQPDVMHQLEAYVAVLVWSIVPLFAYATARRYLQAIHVVKPVTFAIISANLINFGGNWLLIPQMGIRGSAWSTCAARLWMAAVLVFTAWKHGAFHNVRWPVELQRIRRLLSLGLPAAGQIGFEALGFAFVTALAGKLDAASLAAHGIALNVISVTYMVPLGISAAAAVRVGHAIGRKDRASAAAAGWAALLLTAIIMAILGVVLFAAPRLIISGYSHDAGVLRIGTVLLFMAAFFELGDGAQVVATGALRGLGDTRTPMLVNLVVYWALGVPLGWWLCFRSGWGAAGLWFGLGIALLLIGSALTVTWARAIRHVGDSEFRV